MVNNEPRMTKTVPIECVEHEVKGAFWKQSDTDEVNIEILSIIVQLNFRNFDYRFVNYSIIRPKKPFVSEVVLATENAKCLNIVERQTSLVFLFHAIDWMLRNSTEKSQIMTEISPSMTRLTLDVIKGLFIR